MLSEIFLVPVSSDTQATATHFDLTEQRSEPSPRPPDVLSSGRGTVPSLSLHSQRPEGWSRRSAFDTSLAAPIS